MIYTLALCLVSLCIVITFLGGNNRVRLLVALVSLHIYGLVIDVGVQIEPPKIVSFCVILLLLSGVYKYNKAIVQKFDIFFFWILFSSFIGYILLPQATAVTGWARGSDGKPLIQFFTFALSIVFFLIPVNALKKEEDVFWFFRRWIVVVVISAALCYLQTFYYWMFQDQLWGVFRVNSSLDEATVELFGQKMQRANAFGGEPKIQGMHMVYGLILLLYLYNQNILKRSKCIWCILFLLGAILLTYSTGTFMVLGICVAFILINANFRIRKPVFRLGLLLGCYMLFSSLLETPVEPDHTTSAFDKLEEFIAGIRNKETQDNLYGSDKELPATIYLLENPLLSITGIGIGTAPFYYESLVPDRWKGLYLTPNSGILWCIYSFGFIGMVFFTLAIRSALREQETIQEYIPLVEGFLTATAAYLLILTFFYWSFFLLGIIFSPALKQKSHEDTSYRTGI